MADMMSGALGAVTPDPTEDDTDYYSPTGLKSLQSDLAVMRNRELEARKKSWDMVAQRLEQSRPSKAEMWFSLASALAQPTKTGSFGETLGNTAEALGKSAASRREYEGKVADTMLQREQDLSDLGAKYDLKGMDLQSKMAAAAMKRRPTAFNPVDGTLRYMDTGELVNPGAKAPQSEVVRIGDNDFVRNAKGGLDKIERTAEAEAERAGAIASAKDAAIVRNNLPKARANTATALKEIDDLMKHPGLSAVVGVPNPFQGGLGVAEIPGSPAAGFKARLNQLKGRIFLDAYTVLKGGGPIATAEGDKAEKAMARMDTAQSEAEFRQAANDYKSAVMAGMQAMEDVAGMAPQSSGGTAATLRAKPAQATASARKVAPVAPPKASAKPAVKPIPWPGDAAYNKLDPGTPYIGPDGQPRTKK